MTRSSGWPRLPCLYWTQGVETAPALKTAGIERRVRAAGSGGGLARRGPHRRAP